MKKALVFIIALLILSNTVSAQVVQSWLGPDAGNLASCQLVMKNGNSVFLEQNPKTLKYKLVVFNNKLVQVLEKEFDYKSPALKKAHSAKNVNIYLQKIYEIGGKLVMFEMDNKIDGKDQCGLYRILMNPATLEIEKEEQILMINKAGSAINAPTYDVYGTDSPFYYISKDENSDYYAIIKYGHQKRNDEGTNYEVHHYSPDHKEINNVKFDYVNSKYGYARPLNLLVYANKYVILATYAFNSEKKINRDTKIIFSKLEVGKNSFYHEELDYTQDFDADYCTLKKNETQNRIEALIYTKLGEGLIKTRYSLIFQSIEPGKMSLSAPYVLPQKMLDDYAIKHCNEKGYGGSMIKDYQLSPNGTILATSVKNVFFLKDGDALSGNPELIGFSEFNNAGKDINAWAYPHLGNGEIITVCNSKGNFALINEIDENMNKPLNEKFKDVSEKEVNVVLLTLKNNGEISREYVFGKQEKKKNIHMIRGFYDEKSKIYIAWVATGKDEKSRRLAIIKFE